MVNAASIMNQMYRGSPGTAASGPMIISPGVSAPRSSFFAPTFGTANPNAAARVPSGSHATGERVSSSSNSVLSDQSGDVGTSLPPRSTGTAGSSNNFTGAVMTQNKLRPLRLVQENKELEGVDQGRRLSSRVFEKDDAARKRANRASWMGGFNKGKEEEGPKVGVAEDSMGVVVRGDR